MVGQKIKYLNEKQVAEMTGFSLSKLRNDRFLGRGIPYCKVEKSVRYQSHAVVDYMDSGRVETIGY